jgi:hypothetical protein
MQKYEWILTHSRPFNDSKQAIGSNGDGVFTGQISFLFFIMCINTICPGFEETFTHRRYYWLQGYIPQMFA